MTSTTEVAVHIRIVWNSVNLEREWGNHFDTYNSMIPVTHLYFCTFDGSLQSTSLNRFNKIQGLDQATEGQQTSSAVQYICM